MTDLIECIYLKKKELKQARVFACVKLKNNHLFFVPFFYMEVRCWNMHGIYANQLEGVQLEIGRLVTGRKSYQKEAQRTSKNLVMVSNNK